MNKIQWNTRLARLALRNCVKALFRWNRNSRLLLIQAYLIVILVFTFLLFGFSVVSFYREREKVSRSSFELKAKQVVWELENEIHRHAVACLSNTEIQQLSESLDPNSLDQLRHLRKHLQTLEKAHPVARSFFLFDGKSIVFPRQKLPPRQGLQMLLASIPEGLRPRFAEIWQEAEDQERLGFAKAASRFYEHAERMNVNPRLKALAAFRQGEVFRKANDYEAAAKAYQHLLSLYGDQYDQTQTPYILSLAVGRNGASGLVPQDRHYLEGIYRDLANGRWELSSKQVEHFLTLLEQRLDIPIDKRRDSDFLENFRFARIMENQLSPSELKNISDVTSRFFEYEQKPYQVYLTAVGGGNRRIVSGFSVSIPWVSNSLCDLFGDTSRGGENHQTISIVPKSQVPDANDICIPFSKVLPSWKVNLAGELAQLGASNDLPFIAISTFMFFSILSVGLYLLLRVSWDIRWLHLRSDFVSGVSHEFKTPLSLIRLYSETLADSDQDFTPEERRGYIQIITRESERMSRLIENVLSFSRMEQGKHKTISMQTGDIGETVQQTVDAYSEYLKWKGFELSLSIPSSLPPVRFNGEQLSQVILNLLENATKYSGSSKLIGVNVFEREKEVLIEIRDNGLGIPPEEHEKIFQPFYRAPQGSEKGGCGLGLYLVDQVMKGHDGRIELESEVGKGSAFRLVFKIMDARPYRKK